MKLMLPLILTSIFIVLASAFSTLLERQIISSVQIRTAPNKNNFLGYIQPFLDGLKLILKTRIKPILTHNNAPKTSMLLLPTTLAFTLILPMMAHPSNPKYSLLLLLTLSTTFSFLLILVSYLTSSKYANIGAQRIFTQMIAYEITLSVLILMLSVLLQNGLTLSTEHTNQNTLLAFKLPSIFILWGFSILAEMGRTPFDSIEGESEIVSGFNTEFSSTMFVYLFLAEYIMLNTLSYTTACLFLGVSVPLTLTMYLTFMVTVFLTRALLPRPRYDKSMMIFWNSLLPLTLTITLLYTLTN